MTSLPLPAADLISAWDSDHHGRLAPLTRSEYTRYLRRLAADHDLLVVTSFELRRFLTNPSWSASTKNFALRAIRSFCRWCVLVDLRSDDPSEKIPMAKVVVPDVRVADDSIRDALIEACCSVRDRAFVATLFGAGCRRGEIVALTLADVDLNAATLRIPKSKNGRPRTAPLTPHAVKHLRRWLLERRRMDTGADALWLTQRGTALTSAGAKMTLRRVSERAGVTFSSHDARRAYAVNWLRMGGSETSLMAIAGWSSISMVQRYTRMNSQELAIDEARRLFGTT